MFRKTQSYFSSFVGVSLTGSSCILFQFGSSSHFRMYFTCHFQLGSQLLVRSTSFLRAAEWSLRMLHTFCSRLGIHERPSVLL